MRSVKQKIVLKKLAEVLPSNVTAGPKTHFYRSAKPRSFSPNLHFIGFT